MLEDIQSYIVQVIGPFVFLAMASFIAVAIFLIWIADLRNSLDQ